MTTQVVRQWLHDHQDDVIEELQGWVRLRSVAGVPEHDIELRRSAQWLAGTMRSVGFPVVEVWPTGGGGPAVFAEWPAVESAPTVLVYSHHDVRAAKDDQWEQTPPFHATLREGRLFGRGASDAKGQVLAHLWAVRALVADGEHPPVNLKMLVEGEEEMGSPNLADLLTERRDRLDADFAIVSDTMLWAAGAPAVCTGVRGLVQAELEVMGPLTDIHAGAVSGIAPNPIMELARLLAALHGADGRLAVPGFYDTVREPSTADRDHLAQLPWDEQTWVDRTRTRSVSGEAGWSPAERMYLRPSAEVTAIVGGDPVGPSRGAIPSLATAKLQIWLVPDQDPGQVARQLRSWVAGAIGDHVEWELTVTEQASQPPYVTPPDHPALPLLHEAMQRGFEQSVGWMRNAGGAPAGLLAKTLDLPVLFFGTGLPEDRWHDSDESVRLDVLLAGAVSLAEFWRLLPHHLSQMTADMEISP